MTDRQPASAEGIRRLASWAAGIAADDIPAAVRRKAARVLADNFAAMVAARDEPEVTRVHEMTLARPAAREATVFSGGRARTDRRSAAVANAVAACWCELDEGYRVVGCHAGLHALPALLAEAEARNLPAGEVLRALVVAYEVATRFARAWTFVDRQVHSHALYGPVGAASAVAACRGADADTWRDALTAAATFAFVGPTDHAVAGALVRNTWPAVAAFAGMSAVDWASCGIGGLARSPEDVYGRILGGAAQPEQLVDGLGTEWAMLDGYHKVYACCQHAHSTAEAAIAVRDDLPPGSVPGRIECILVDTHRQAIALQDCESTTTLGGKFSLPYITAAALVLGHAGYDAFTPSRLVDPLITEIRRKVRIAPFTPEMAPPNDRPARVRVMLDDGSSVTRECLSAVGGPNRPLADAMLMEKFVELTGPVYPGAAHVVQSLMELEPAALRLGWADTVAALCETRAAGGMA